MSAEPEVERIVVIGGGQAAAMAVRTLRTDGYQGGISVLSEEGHLPYERPPLSKAVLTGTADVDSICLMPEGFVVEHYVDYRRGVRALAIDRTAQRVKTSTGESLAYDRLLIATGSRPRRIDGDLADRSNVFYLRTIEDSAAIRAAIAPGKTLLAIGAGWIGLEVAATARRLGMEAVVVEMADRACGRSLPADVGAALVSLHRDRGTRVLLETRVVGVEGTGQVDRVRLSNGETLDVAMVVVGIGAIPNDDIAREAGLEVVGGVLVDANTRTSDPLIFAAGDVAAFRTGEALWRLESWANAQNQGVAAAKNMLGLDAPYQPNTWFWSDQYDVNIQIIGSITDPLAQVFTRRGERQRFTQLYVRDRQIVGAICFGQPREMTFVRKLIRKSYRVSGDELETSEDLQKLL
ncbi:NAD(P)/FAD-dependent oxidoreductase [Xanthobacter autotrophicus]|uniref:NAD(P)/FAD-dependent oxidoreductase n=1 Tax=Xanthobacter autotrophicus TaxID=280 RepID=UPI00372A01D9